MNSFVLTIGIIAAIEIAAVLWQLAFGIFERTSGAVATNGACWAAIGSWALWLLAKAP